MRKPNSFTDQLTPMQLMELDACTQCGECLKCCPVQDVTGNPSISPPEKIRIFREFIKATDGLKATLFGPKKVDQKLVEHFLKAIYECTTCGGCGESCSVGIFTQRLWPALRREMVRRGLGPIGPQADLPKTIAETGNPYNKPPVERYVPWFPERVRIAERAEIAYYAGCTGAYEAQPMVRGDVLVLGAIGEPLTMLPPEEEVCCGFPLFITGQHEMLKDPTKRLGAARKVFHENAIAMGRLSINEAVGKKADRLILSCPACYAKVSEAMEGYEKQVKITDIMELLSGLIA